MTAALLLMSSCVAFGQADDACLTWARRAVAPAVWTQIKDGDFFWLPNGDILSIQDREERTLCIIRLNPKTGRRSGKTFTLSKRYVSSDVSSDGRYLVLMDHLMGTALLRLSDGRQFHVGTSVHGSVQWLRGSTHWLELQSGVTGHLFSPPLLVLGTRRTLPRRELLPAIAKRPINTTHTAAIGGTATTLYVADVDGEMPDVVERPYPLVRHTTLRTLRIGRRVREMRRQKFRLPQRGQLRQMLFSPDCTHLAFVLRVPAGKNEYADVLYCCRRDGKAMQKIGQVRVPEYERESGGVQTVKWLPNGNSLSFVYQDMLWLVSTKE